jgi:hypothetical protein
VYDGGMKRYLLLLILLFVFPHTAVADSGWTIRSFDSQIHLEPDGLLDVRETIVADFGDIAKHGIYRDLPIRYRPSDGGESVYTKITDVAVTQDKARADAETSQNDDYLNIRIGDPDKTITGLHTYEIHYQVLGALRSFDGFDEIAWNVTGNEWEIPIEQSTATVTLPSGEILQAACYEGSIGSTDRCKADFTPKQTNAQFVATRDFGSGEGMTVSVGYPSGLVPIVTVPRPPTITEQLFRPIPIAIFIITLLIGLKFIWDQYNKHGRDAVGEVISNTIVAEYESPSGLRPAELGVLVDERADTLDITATIIDLASRGFLTIKEEPKKWLFGQTDYILTRLPKKATLLPYEQKLINSLFDEGDTVAMSSLKNTFYTELAAVKSSLYETVTDNGYFVSNPEKIRNRYLAFGIIIAIFGGIGTAVSLGAYPPFASFTIPLAILGVVTFASSFAMPARTAKGRELYRQALGYKLFIDTAEKYRARFAENENLFTEVLPYAIVFGATKKFAKAMNDMGLQPAAPAWYVGTHQFNPIVFASDIDTFSSSLSTAMVSSPSSSGGGGSSGGGFGGGGGGSW